jgi:FMN phosphatase YigB (HAD superfamily)
MINCVEDARQFQQQEMRMLVNSEVASVLQWVENKIKEDPTRDDVGMGRDYGFYPDTLKILTARGFKVILESNGTQSILRISGWNDPS